MPRRARTDANLQALLDERDRELSAAREAVAATQGVLRAINEGQGDAQAVLDAVVERAGRLLDATTVVLQLRFGEATRGVATYAPPGAPANPWLGPVSLTAPGDRIPATAGSLSGRAMAERRPVAVD